MCTAYQSQCLMMKRGSAPQLAHAELMIPIQTFASEPFESHLDRVCVCVRCIYVLMRTECRKTVRKI